MVKVIIVRQWGAEHVTKSRYWHSWYLENVIQSEGDILARIRRYWRGDCRDAFVVPDTETAEDIALTYDGLWAERVRYMAACIALGEEPDADGGQRAALIPDQPLNPSPSNASPIDQLMAS